MTTSLFYCRSGLILAALSLAGLAASLPAAASTITAVSFDSSHIVAAGDQFSLGYTFTVGATALNVISVGYLNDGATGANATHQVEIYQITGGNAASPTSGTSILSSPVSVTTSGGSASNNTFSFISLATPITLAANTDYEIVGADNGNGAGANAVNSVFSGITYGNATFSYATTPVFNANTYSTNNVGHFGPNFQFTPAGGNAAPEPSQLAGLGFSTLGVFGLILKARKRRIATDVSA